jgi:CRISPR type III-B/RAMP module RAMP protein Cmr6
MLNSIRNDINIFQNKSGNLTTNLSLVLEKLNSEIDEPAQNEHGAKDAALDKMCNFKLSDENNRLYSLSYTAWESAVTSLNDVEIFYVKTITKTLLGTGNASVFEFGFNLLKPFGIPYISGSSLKGLVSSYLARYGGDKWSKSNKTAEKSMAQVQIFGGKYDKDNFIGSVNFYDARIVPGKQTWFVQDIITPHNPSYYSERQLPDGTENPIPLRIAALDQGLKFLVVLQGPEKERKFVKQILLKALDIVGIGGKTAVGFGRFEYVISENEKNDLIKNANIEDLKKHALGKNKIGIDHLSDEAIRFALEKNEISEELENAYKKYTPLRFIRLQIIMNKINSFDAINGLVKEIKQNLKNNPIEKSNPDGQFIFNYVINNFKPKPEQISENRLLSQIAFTWDNIEINNENIYEIIDSLNKRSWPCAADLRTWIMNSNLRDRDDLLALF